MKKVFRSCLVMMLVAVMIFTNVTPAFAAGSGDKTINYVCFGDSTTNGYYMNSTVTESGNAAVPYWPVNDATGKADVDLNMYGWGRQVTWSYPTLLRDHMEGMGYDVNYMPMAISGFRVEELHVLLDDDYQGDAYGQGRFNGTSGWFNLIIQRSRTLVAQDQAAGRTPDPNLVELLRLADENGGDYMTTMRTMARNTIANADLITIDLGMNNFGTYVTDRLSQRVFSGSVAHEIWWYEAYPEMLTEGQQLTAELYAKFNCPDLVGTPAEPATSAVGQLFAALVADAVYGYLGFITHYEASMKHIEELNPDATVVFIAPYNSMVGVSLKAELNGEEQLIPMGQVWEYLMGKANAFAKEYQAAPGMTYVYVDPVSSDSRVNLMFDQLVQSYQDYKANKTPEVSINMFAALRPMIDGALENNALLDGAYATVDQNANMITWMGMSTEAFKAAISRGVQKGADRAIHEVTAPTMGAILEDAVIDLDALLGGGWNADSLTAALINDMTPAISHIIVDEIEAELRAYLGSCGYTGVAQDTVMYNYVKINQIRDSLPPANEPASTLSENDKSILALYLRFMFEQGVMVHPDETGYEQIADAVKNLYAVSDVSVDVNEVPVVGGDVNVTLTGSKLPNGLNVYAVCGDEIIYARTTGSADAQTATITLPENTGETAMTWTVGYGSLTEEVLVTTNRVVWTSAEGNAVVTFYGIDLLEAGNTVIAAHRDGDGKLDGAADGTLVETDSGALQVTLNAELGTGWQLFVVDSQTFAPVIEPFGF